MTLTLFNQLQLAVAGAASARFFELGAEVIVDIATSAHADYQCNSPLKWAKLLGRPPRVIAEELVEELLASQRDLICRAEIAGPGFCNLWICPRQLERFLLADQWDAARGQTLAGERILVDFSSPNIAKEMHVGHLRSTIIGDCLARLFTYLGAEVLRINHLGDWGTQFGMLIAHLAEAPLASAGDLDDLMNAYQAAKERFDSDLAFKTRAQAAVIQLQSEDEAAVARWREIVAISLRAFEEIYDLLGVKLIARGESHYNGELQPMVSDLAERGHLTVSEGAKCLFCAGIDVPLMVQKSDGGFSYDATDLAALRHRVERDGVDRIVYVTDAGQALHFQLLFRAGRQVQYLPDRVRVDHVPFGLVLASDGKKFRTRSGHIVKLKELLGDAIARARQLIDERDPPYGDEVRSQLARDLGISAVKYADLATDRRSDYTYSPERMLRFEGNTAPFLLYALVRTRGIERRLGEAVGAPTLRLEHLSEQRLALDLARFSEVIESCARDLLPHRLAQHLFSIAQSFNAFFRDCPVLNDPAMASRAHLTRLTGRVLSTGLELLGLTPVDQM